MSDHKNVGLHGWVLGAALGVFLSAGVCFGGETNIDLDAIKALEVTPDGTDEVTVKTKDGSEGGCPVKLAITVNGEVEANGGTEGFYDDVVLEVDSKDYTLFGGDKSGNPNWELDDDFVGVSKTESVTVKVKPGDVIKLKYLTRNQYWNDGWGAKIVDVQVIDGGCSSGSCSSGGGGAGNGCVDLTIDLGDAETPDKSAGILRVIEILPSQAIFSPESLKLASGLYGYTRAERAFANGQMPTMAVINQNGGLWQAGQAGQQIRQIIVPDSFVDIVQESSTRYQIRFYEREDVGARNTSGFFELNSGVAPKQTWTIENPDSTGVDINHVNVTHNTGSKTITYHYEWVPTNNDWTLVSGSGSEAITFERIKTVSGNTEDNQLITSGNGLVASVSGEVKTQFSFGNYVTESYSGAPGERSSTFYEYWPANSGDNTGRLKKITYPNGSWEYFNLYDSQGRVLEQVEQMEDNPYTGSWPDNLNRSFVYTYTDTSTASRVETLTKVKGVNSRREWLHKYLPTDTRTSIGQVLPDSYRLVSVATDMSVTSYQHASNIKTYTYYYPRGASSAGIENFVSAVVHPDGTKEIYQYADEGDGVLLTQRWQGVPDSTGTTIVDGTLEETRINRQNEIIAFTRRDIVSSTVLEQYWASEIDPLGRPTTIVYNDGTEIRRSYGCCGLMSETDRKGFTTRFEYDSHDRKNREELWYGSTMKSYTDFVLDAAGRVISTTWGEPGGLGIPPSSAQYDSQGRIISQTDGGITKTYQFEDQGRRVIESGPGDNEVISEYYYDGRLKSRTGSAVVGEYFTYGVNSGYGPTRGYEWTEVHYTAAGSPRYVKTMHDRMGRETIITRPAFSGTNTEEIAFDAGGRELSRAVTGYANQLTKHDGLGRVVAKGYDVDGNGELTPASSDEYVTISYSFEQISGVTYQVEETNTFAAVGDGQATLLGITKQRVDGLSLSKTSETISIDQLGTISTASRAIDPATRTETETVTSSLSGQSAIRVYIDGELRQATDTSSVGTRLRAYDAAGRLYQQTDPRTNSTATTLYEPIFGKVERVTTGDRFVRYEYYPATHINAGMLKLEEHNGKTTNYEYNARGQLTLRYGDEYPIRYEYNEYGELRYMWTYRAGLNGTGDRTEWVYQPSTGLLLAKKDAQNKGPQYTYFPSGLLQTRTWARGVATNYTYDTTGGLTGIDYSDATPDVLFSLDRLNRRTSTTMGGTIITRTFLAATGTPTSEACSGDDGAHTVSLGFGSYGRRNSLDVSVGTEVLLHKGYQYDSFGRIWKVDDGGVSAEYGYFPNSNLMEQTTTSLAGSTVLVTQRQVNEFGETTGVTARKADNTLVDSVTYEINDLGQRTARNEPADLAWSYGYNSHGEVISGVKTQTGNAIPGFAFEYGYDTIGNRLTRISSGAIETYISNELNQYSQINSPGVVNIRGKASEHAFVSVNNEQVTKTAGYFFKSLSVDNAATAKLTEVNVSAVIPGATQNDPDQVDEVNGKVFTPKASQAVTYDDDGNLTDDGRWSYSWDSENRLVGMTKTFAAEEPMSLSFQYDEIGRRRSKTVVTGTGGSATTKTVFFAWDGWILTAEWQASAGVAANIKSFLWGLDLSGSETGAGGIGGLVAVGQNGAKYFPVADAMGNIRTVVDSGGAKVSSIDYGPFGEPLGAFLEYCPFSFSSKYADTESALLYYGYRYYNPETGRWVNRDPIEEEGGTNLYGMVGNDPAGRLDFLGLNMVMLPPSHPGSDENQCENLFVRIWTRIREVEERRNGLLKDQYKFFTTDPKKYNTHQLQMAGKQANLKKLLDQWDKNDCGNKTGRRIEAFDRAVADLPIPNHPSGFVMPKEEVRRIDWEQVQMVGVGTVGVVVIAGIFYCSSPVGWVAAGSTALIMLSGPY